MFTFSGKRRSDLYPSRTDQLHASSALLEDAYRIKPSQYGRRRVLVLYYVDQR